MVRILCIALASAALSCFAGGSAAPFARSLAEAESHSVTLGTNKVHYVTAGGGPDTIVFVHCWSGNLGFWCEQVSALADKARLVLIDLPGHGQSDKPRTDYTMDYFASAVLAVMSDAQVTKATLAGHSMGAAVICRVYHQAPEKVAALVSVDGLMRRPRMAPAKVAIFVATFRTPAYREYTRQFFGAMFPVPGTEVLRDRVLSEMLATPQYVMSGAMEGMFGLDQPDWALNKVDVPVLVINANNPMWDADYENYVRSISSKTEYQIMPGAGHWLMLEKPAEFNEAFTDMLGKFGLIAK